MTSARHSSTIELERRRAADRRATSAPAPAPVSPIDHLLRSGAGNHAIARAAAGARFLQRTTKAAVVDAINGGTNAEGRMQQFKRWVAGQKGDFDDDHEVDQLLAHRSVEDVLALVAMMDLKVTQTGHAFHSASGAKINVDPYSDLELAQATGSARGHAAGRNRRGAKAAELVWHIHSRLDNDKQQRDDLVAGAQNTAKPLGDLLSRQALMCREKALFAQLLLADIGIPSVVHSGARLLEDEERDPKGPALQRSRHAWLVVAGTWEVDPIKGAVCATLDRIERYWMDAKEETVIAPAQPLQGEELGRVMGVMVTEFERLSGA
jgi:hypothetical protein